MTKRESHTLVGSYLLRIWQERDELADATNYRWSLIDPYTHQRYSFTSLPQMAAFLEDRLQVEVRMPDGEASG